MEWENKMKRKRMFIGITLVLLFSLSFVILIIVKQNQSGWETAEPWEVGMDTSIIDDLEEALENDYKHIRSVTIVKDNKLVFEKYREDYNKNSLFVLNSATKTVTATLIGIAIHEGFISNVGEPMVNYFPQYQELINDEEMKDITIKNLLTMTSGIKWTEANLNKWFDTIHRSYRYDGEIGKNPIAYALQSDVIMTPGRVFNYNTLNSQILSGMLASSSGMKSKHFLEKYLFNPLGINKYTWHTDPHIWVTEAGGYDAFFAGGHGGQFIYGAPELNLVVTITSDIDFHRENHRLIIDEYIIPAIEI